MRTHPVRRSVTGDIVERLSASEDHNEDKRSGENERQQQRLQA
jgi:hypothetical protein